MYAINGHWRRFSFLISGLVLCLSVLACDRADQAAPKSPGPTASARAAAPAGEGVTSASSEGGGGPQSPEDPGLVAATRFARTVFRPFLKMLAQRECMDLVVTGAPRQFSEQWEPGERLVTFYFGRYGVDIPRALITSLGSPGIYWQGIDVGLRGNCSLSFWVQEELLAPLLRAYPDDIVFSEESVAAVEQRNPGFTERFRDELRQRLSFESDYEVYRKLYSTDFADIDVSTMSMPDLLEALMLLGIKSGAVIDGAEDSLELVETPHFHGFVYGSLDIGEREIIQLQGPGEVIMGIFGCYEHLQAKKEVSRPHLEAIVASLRLHNHPSPGAAMLAAAKRELTASAEDNATEIARCLVLAASRHDDVYPEALALSRELIDENWGEYRTASWLRVLERTYDDDDDF